MEELFLEIVNRSLTAGVLILIVILLRACCKKMPKWVRLVLWFFVAVRLICPVTLESKFSLMPDTDNVIEFLEEASEQKEPGFTEQMQFSDSGSVENVNSEITDSLWQENTETTGANDTPNQNPMEEIQQDQIQSENHTQFPVTESSKEERPEDDRQVSDFDIPPEQPQVPDTTGQEQPVQNKTGQLSVLSVATILWLMGMVCLCLYSTVKYFRLKQQVRISINEKENIYLCDIIDTPFVLGFFSPKIYLPSGLEKETEEYAVLHEKEHLRCGDQWWKLLSFLLLVLYWFHPLVWMAYLLACNDIEYACDERVIKRLEREERKAYTKALLSCSMGHRTMLFYPPSFVRNSVKKRVRSVVDFKKTTIPVLCLAVMVCVIMAVTFLTDRKQGGSYEIELNGAELSKKTAEHIAEEIAELMQDSTEGISNLENFSFAFYELESEQENRVFRVSVEADSTSLREPEDSPLIQGMLKAQSEFSYEEERNYIQTIIDAFLKDMKASAKERICEPAIVVTIDEADNYELHYGSVDGMSLPEYFQPESEEMQHLLGYLTVYQRIGSSPVSEMSGNVGYVYSKALDNPENKNYNPAGWYTGSSLLLYYREGVYDEVETYHALEKSELPLELLGEELVPVYGNRSLFWSERDKLAECTGTGTLYELKGYEDSFRVALYYEESGDEASTHHLVICERLNDLWLYEGRELFQERLHLEDAVSVTGFDAKDELLWEFLAEIFEAKFIQPKDERLPDFEELSREKMYFFDALGLEHMVLLFEEGYVIMEAEGECQFIVKIEEELCQQVIAQVQVYKAGAPVSFANAIPVDAILNQEEGYQAAYERIVNLASTSLTSGSAMEWADEEGYYISRVPIRYYNVEEEKLSEQTRLILFSEDFNSVAEAGVFWSYGNVSANMSYGGKSPIHELLKAYPTGEFIFLYTEDGTVLLDSENVVRYESLGIALLDQQLELEENLYQILYSDELAVSYEELTAKENLIWVPMEKITVPKVTPTPAPTSEASENEALKTLNLPLLGRECTLQVIGKKRADMDVYGVREIKVYAGVELIQSVLIQEAIDADGVDGIDKGYSECPYIEELVSLRDVNFDGYPDLEVWGWSPNNSIPYYYWCWNPETQQFEYAFCLQLTDIDEERKQLISYTKAGGGVYYIARYRVTKENKLELAERMTEDYRTFINWQEAYREVIYNFPDNMMDLNNPYATRDTSDWANAEKCMYLGILDFDADGTPELLIGDTVSLAVFTFRNGKVEKCTEVILPNGFNRIDDVGFKENAVIVNCYGASAFGHAAVTYRDGKWINATCSNADGEIFINGEKAASEAWNTVMPFPVDEWGNIEKLGRIPREYMNCVVKEKDGSYVLYTWTKEEGTWYYEYGWTETGVALDATFDFEQLRWTKD